MSPQSAVQWCVRLYCYQLFGERLTEFWSKSVSGIDITRIIIIMHCWDCNGRCRQDDHSCLRMHVWDGFQKVLDYIIRNTDFTCTLCKSPHQHVVHRVWQWWHRRRCASERSYVFYAKSVSDPQCKYHKSTRIEFYLGFFLNLPHGGRSLFKESFPGSSYRKQDLFQWICTITWILSGTFTTFFSLTKHFVGKLLHLACSSQRISTYAKLVRTCKLWLKHHL